MSSPTIGIPATNNVEDKITFHTSANFLCNFMEKREYLVESLSDMALKPRYVEERIEYLHLDGFSALAFPMTCFCDIPLSKAEEHMGVYGHYGIALNKIRCMKRNVQPITYLNMGSSLGQDFKDAFQALIGSGDYIDDQWSFLPDVLLSIVLYTKPIQGHMRRGGENLLDKLFMDECEWRYIPTMPDGMPLTLPPVDNTRDGRREYSNALALHKGTWFDFKVNDIEHIIVPDESEALKLIREINSMDDKDDETRHKLMSKIEVAEKFKLNFV